MSSSHKFEICSCNEVDCYYCDSVDPFFTPSSAGSYMSHENFEELKKAEEQQEEDKESSRLLTQLANDIESECKQAQEWIDLNKNKIKEHKDWIKKSKKAIKTTEKRLAEKDEQLIHIMVKKDRFEDKMRIRDDYITMEKEKYPLQFPEFKN